MSYSAFFLGVGSASQVGLGHAACVIEKHNKPWLLIDCGPDTLTRYQEYSSGDLPSHLFITHLHFDHIGGLEQLFFQAFSRQQQPTLYVPTALVHKLTQILSHTGLAEGGVNLWQQLRIVPVLEQFWHQDTLLKVHPVRHHQPHSAFALHLPGVFFYSGDTRPIPEILHFHAANGETILHDCGLKGNPSHSGVGDLFYEYNPDTLSRIHVYHYQTAEEADKIRAQGLRVLHPGERLVLGASAQFGFERYSELAINRD